IRRTKPTQWSLAFGFGAVFCSGSDTNSTKYRAPRVVCRILFARRHQFYGSRSATRPGGGFLSPGRAGSVPVGRLARSTRALGARGAPGAFYPRAGSVLVGRLARSTRALGARGAPGAF